MGALVFGLAGCSGEVPPSESGLSLGDGQLADPCNRTEDCASGLCVRLDPDDAICSKSCSDDTACPTADNWACLPSSDSDLKVCACLKLDDRELCSDLIDNDCDGAVDDCRVCDGRPVPEDDPEHCGACGNACRSDQSCLKGTCECSDSELVECGGTCVDLETDNAHCGACGDSCGPEQVCLGGECTCPDAQQPDFCPSVGCVDLESDGEHCGDCGEACTLATVCSGGECTCPDAQQPDFCPDLGCVDLQNDPAHCGDCDEACGLGRVCSEGSCECPPGQTECDGDCVNTNNDAEHCGGCGRSCGPDQACSGAECGCSQFGYSSCGSACYDLDFDAEHCGACEDATCLQGESCSSGSCECDSELYCDDVCVPVSDNENCGACGAACPDGQYCSVDQCVCSAFGLSVCGESCFDLKSDEAHCGACGTACKNGESCVNGLCRCPTGQTYCEAAGTCVDLSYDEAHCGSCGAACDPTETCQNKVCKCPTAGQLYCSTENACTNVQSNVEHCGTCDQACDPTEVCKSGVCQCPASTESYCASISSCVDVWTSEAHCGACENACPAETSCISASCKCDAPGHTLCPDDVCYDLQNDTSHCGSCGKSCSDNYSCIGGQCRCPNPTVGTPVRATNDTVDDFYLAADWDGTHVGVAFRAAPTSGGTANLKFALLNPDGTVVSVNVLKSYGANSGGVLYGPDLVWSGSEYAVVWSETNYPASTLLFQRVSASGALIGNAITVASETNGQIAHPSVAWSPSYGGYAAAYVRTFTSMGVALKLLGATGMTQQAENLIAGYHDPETTAVVLDQEGNWGVAFGASGAAYLAVFNPDGSRTKPLGQLNMTTANRWVALAHDGATWVSAWQGTSPSYGIYDNRGTSTNSPAALVTWSSIQQENPVLEMVNGTLALGYLHHNAGGEFRMRRFAIPSTTSSTLTPLHDSVEILTTQNITGTGTIDLVATGTHSMLAVWSDDRWGATTREIYAAPIDLQSCP